jgi:type II secretory pathway component PulJ
VNTRSNSSTALTLLETILAISMLAMILLALHTALSSGIGAYRRCRDSSERDTMAWGAIRLLAEDLLRLALQGPPPSAPTLLGVPQVREAGSCMLRLQTNARPAPEAKEMLVDYFFMPADSGGSLIRRSQPLGRPGAGGSAGAESAESVMAEAQGRYEILATGLRAVRLRYFDGQGWSERWNSAEPSRPPRLVEVVLEFPARDGTAEVYAQALPVAVEGFLIGAPAGKGSP